MEIGCVYSNPLTASGVPPTGSEAWQFSTVSCSHPYISYIENGQGQYFYLDERISFGDLFIGFFLLIFLMFFIFKAVWTFFMPVSIKALTRNDL